MSDKPKNTRKKFSYQGNGSAPTLSRYKTEWDLKRLYYKGDSDPQIEADLQAAESAYKQFARKWRTKDFITNSKILAGALADYESLAGNPVLSRPGRYYALRLALDAGDSKAEKSSSLISQRLRHASDQILFFVLRLGQVSLIEQKKLLSDPGLAHYRYYLETVFAHASHHLTEPEERIIKLKARQGSLMWVDMVEKLLSQREIKHGNKTLPIPEALETIDTLKSTAKPKLWDSIMTVMEEVGAVAEHEFNAVITDAYTESDLRGYKKPYSATALSYEDNEASIENLVKVVSTDGFQLSRRFYKLKAKYHGLESLHYSQKYDSIGVSPSISFSQAVDICRSVFYDLKTEYGEIFDRMLQRGQIDVFPRKGKRGGAFMSSDEGQPTQVFLNHVTNFKSLETLAHEMGHAIHAERSKQQTPLYQGFSTVTAETASTLFENLVFDAVYAVANPSEKTVLLHDRITRDIATIERQIAFFNCELEIHQTIRAQGAMTNAELATTMVKHLRAYLGSAVKVEPKDGYSYVYIPHLRYGFYVYTYSFGLLLSTIMANYYKSDHAYIEEIDHFLCSGSSASVAETFRAIGIDTKSPSTFSGALQNHAQDIADFARLIRH